MRNLGTTNTITFNNVNNGNTNDIVNNNTPDKNSELYVELLLNELYSNIINVNDINDNNKYEELFLYLIRVNNVKDCIRLLNLKKIKNLNYQNKDGNTALHYSLANNLKEATYFLLFTLKVDYNVLNSSDNSPLYWGVLNKSIDSIRILLLYDYNVNISVNKDYRDYNINNLLSSLENINRDELKLDNHITNYYNLNNYDNKSNHNEYVNNNRLNILQKNKFNVSILSELYNINNLDLLQLILEHPISTVLDKTQPDNVDINNNKSNNKDTNNTNEVEDYIIHNFQFIDSNIGNNVNNNEGNEYKISIKEIGIDNNENKILNSKDSELDITGLIIWESSIIASFWIFDLLKQYYHSNSNSNNIDNNTNNNNMNNTNNNTNNVLEDNNTDENKINREIINVKLNSVLNNENGLKVLELGSGCGLLGISVYKAFGFFNKKIDRLVLSDYSDNTLKNLKYNLELNKMMDNGNRIEMMQINWKNFVVEEEYDIVIGCDLIYDVELVKPLVNVVSKMLSENGVFLYAYKMTRNGADEFINELNSNRFVLNIENAPKEYQKNPFVDKSKEYCLSFFPDLGSDDYMLLKAVKSPDV